MWLVPGNVRVNQLPQLVLRSSITLIRCNAIQPRQRFEYWAFVIFVWLCPMSINQFILTDSFCAVLHNSQPELKHARQAPVDVHRVI